MFATFFDERIFNVPLFRFASRDERRPFPEPPGATARDRFDGLMSLDYAICAATTHGTGRLIGDRWQEGEFLWNLVLLDEASQLSVPEFLVATTGLRQDGRMIIVGDHRQMPPIIHGDPEVAQQTRVDPFPAFHSIFDLVRDRLGASPSVIRFEESHRIHRETAEFLRRSIYDLDGISFRSNKFDLGEIEAAADPFATAVLQSESAITLVVHNDRTSQQSNILEADLAVRLVAQIGEQQYPPSVGIVVPHRAQRTMITERLAELGPDVESVLVDTVERFQGDERDIIIVSVTEADPAYLRATGDFLFDARRLNVAISRAKTRVCILASEAVFATIPSSLRQLEHLQIWRQLHDDVCTRLLWDDIVAGRQVRVMGGVQLIDPDERD